MSDPTNESRSWSGPASAMLAAFVLVASFTAPTAFAETSTHAICLGDSDAYGERELGSGCAESWIDTWFECGYADGTYRCELWGTIGVDVTGLGTCARTMANDAPLNVTENATACHALADDLTPRSRGTATELLSNYTHDEIPWEGRPVVVNVTACAHPAGVEDDRVCEEYQHVDRVPPFPCQRSDCGGPFYFVEGQTDHTKRTAEHSRVPVSVYP